jgi:hypothetical protein
MVEISILNPVADEKAKAEIKSAPKLSDLDGKRIGLFWNGKAGGDVILSQTAELLHKRYNGIIFKNYTGKDSPRKLAPEQADDIAKECDAVIASTFD